MTSWRVWLIDLALAFVAAVLAVLALFGDGPTDWEALGKALIVAFLTRAIPQTITFLGDLRRRYTPPVSPEAQPHA